MLIFVCMFHWQRNESPSTSTIFKRSICLFVCVPMTCFNETENEAGQIDEALCGRHECCPTGGLHD